MAAFTSKAAGDVGTSGQVVWNEAGVPGNGDTVTISHALTQNSNWTIGTSTSGVTAITIASGGSLTQGAGVTLTLRGNITSVGNISVGAGSTIKFDSTLTASPTTTRFNFKFTNSTAALISTATSGSRGSVTSDTTGGALAGYLVDPGVSQGNSLNCSYVTFSKIGDDSQVNNLGGKSVLSHVKFDNCGRYDNASSNIGAATDIDWSDVEFLNTPSVGANVGLRMTFDASTTGLRRFRNVALDKQAWFNGDITNFDIDGLYTVEFLRFGEPSGGSGGSNGSLKNTLSAAAPSSAQATVNFVGTIDGLYSLMPAATAKHSVDYEPVVAGTLEVKNSILEFLGTGDSASDFLVNNEISSPQALTLNIHNNLVLPTSDGEASGSLFQIARSAINITVQCDHNTLVMASSAGQGTALIEGSTTDSIGRPGLLSSGRSNLAWANLGKESHLFKAVSSNRQASHREEVDRGTLTGVTSTSFSDSTRSWDAGLFTNVQCYIRMTSGAANGQVTAITSNTLTTTANVASWAITPSNGDTYVIFCKDFYDPANVGYNGLFRPLTTGIIYRPDGTTTTSVTGYHAHYITSGTPGGNDITAQDPGFVDATRNFAAWSVHKGYSTGGDSDATKIANAQAAIIADTSQISTLVADLLLWVFGGFAPTNTVYRNAGHDSVTTGAVEIPASGSSWYYNALCGAA